MIGFKVIMPDGKGMTVLTDQCKTLDEMKEAIKEKLCREPETVEFINKKDGS